MFYMVTDFIRIASLKCQANTRLTNVYMSTDIRKCQVTNHSNEDLNIVF